MTVTGVYECIRLLVFIRHYMIIYSNICHFECWLENCSLSHGSYQRLVLYWVLSSKQYTLKKKGPSCCWSNFIAYNLMISTITQCHLEDHRFPLSPPHARDPSGRCSSALVLDVLQSNRFWISLELLYDDGYCFTLYRN